MTDLMTREELDIYKSKQCDLESHMDALWDDIRWVDSLNREGIKIPCQYKLRLRGIVEVAQAIIERNPLETE